jgi:hypothetical protein
MKDFWQLLSILTSLAGFLIVAGVLLVRGEDILIAAIRAVLVFAALWAVQNILRGLLSLTAGATATTDHTNGDGQ